MKMNVQCYNNKDRRFQDETISLCVPLSNVKSKSSKPDKKKKRGQFCDARKSSNNPDGTDCAAMIATIQKSQVE